MAWWVLADVCKALGIGTAANVASRLDTDEKADIDLINTSSNGVSQTRKFTIINESGLYSAILRSDKPQAKAKFNARNNLDIPNHIQFDVCKYFGNPEIMERNKEDVLTIRDAANRLRCSEQSVRREVKSGRLGAFRLRRKVLVLESDLATYVKHFRVNPTL